MAKVYCDKCKTDQGDIICLECHYKEVQVELDKTKALIAQMAELNAKIKKMGEFINAFDQLTKIKEKL